MQALSSDEEDEFGDFQEGHEEEDEQPRDLQQEI